MAGSHPGDEDQQSEEALRSENILINHKNIDYVKNIFFKNDNINLDV